MKVALVGNMNNNFFALIRYLHHRGVDADLLLLDDEQSHFTPAQDAYDDDWERYTKQLEWGNPWGFRRTSKQRIREDLAPYDVIIACASVPAFAEKAGRQVDIFVPYGGDYSVMPFFGRTYMPKQYLKSILQFPFFLYQRRGIRNARCINWEHEPPAHRRDLELLGVLHKTEYFKNPMVYTGIYARENISKYYGASEHYETFKRVRDEHDLVVFNHGRQVWKTVREPRALKGVDRQIRAFARFVRENPDVKACMVYFEYGYDVDLSKALIRECGIEERVVWIPKLARKDIMIGLSMADFATGQFVYGWCQFGTLLEALTLGVPVLHYADLDAFAEPAREVPPLVNVRTEAEILGALNDWVANPEPFREIGQRGFEWLREGFEASVDRFIELIELKRSGGDITSSVGHGARVHAV